MFSPQAIVGQEAHLGPDLARRMERVLRLRVGDHVLLLDNSGREYEVELTALAATAAQGVVLASRQGAGEPNVRLVLYQALIKGQRFDWVLEKGTELGVAAFVPIVQQPLAGSTLIAFVGPPGALAARHRRGRRAERPLPPARGITAPAVRGWLRGGCWAAHPALGGGEEY